MRAAELLARRSETGRRRTADLLGVESADIESLTQAMRSPRVGRRVESEIQDDRVREDVWLISANPFDPIYGDEVFDAERLVELGLLAPEGNHFEVNIDFALTLVPHAPIEFGFCATLLARMQSTDLALMARAVEVGPRASVVDYLLDIAQQCVGVEAVERRLAHLREHERDVLRRALELGDLPDSVDGLLEIADRPQVFCDDGPAGQRALVFVVDQPSRGVTQRPVVPLELVRALPDLLERVPPAPETEVRRVPMRRRRTHTSEPGTETQVILRADSTLTGERLPIQLPLGPSRWSTGAEERRPVIAPDAPVERSSVTTVQASSVARRLQGRPVSGVVDLEDARFAEVARGDAELGASVLEVVCGSLVILRPGTDVAEWAERAAEKLQFH